ncbi:hypothetical protein Q6D67_20380 [Haliea sp. E1-2-M8]|uniref:hypothetical protein n=1 Tax=Haliea sp. E1-2-M8 TaxID=3064706 RepID=UPI0027194DBE|nr:hypothetical protein [Haliea sp. E1-2-M8]MDO8864048.1 hypothetical protein [Haliea sp. E1-2-M8]
MQDDREFLDDLIDKNEIASILCIKPESIGPLKARGRLAGIEFYLVGRKLRATRSSVVRFIKGSRAA